MNSAVEPIQEQPLTREARFGMQADILGEIYEPICNLAVWQRDVDRSIKAYLNALEEAGRKIYLRSIVSAGEGLEENARAELERALPKMEGVGEGEVLGRESLIENAIELLQMYECLFDTQEIGMRMASLEKAMCPKFHVDFLPARLVTCYSGAGTQWLPDPASGEKRVPDIEPQNFNQITEGDVALLKGDGWFDNEGFGIVHRSPPVADGETRVFLSLDFAS